MEAYSTLTVRRTERVDYWQDLCSRTYADLELAACDHRNFEGELRRSYAGPFSFIKVSSSAARITRSEDHTDRATAHRFEIFLTVRGESACIHHGHRTLLRPGDFTLVDISLPYRFEFDAPCCAVSVGMCQSELGSYLPVPALYLGRAISGAHGVSRLASLMLACLCEQVQSGEVREVGPSLARGMLDVISTACIATIGLPASGTALAGSRRVQIRTFIEANLRDPQLTPGTIAAALGISPRYLRLLFSQEEESISRYITRRRIEEATRELTAKSWRGSTITEIAYRWGFSDTARFTRVFREHFGVSPRHYRKSNAP